MAPDVDAIRLPPPTKTRVLDEYDVDQFVLEADMQGVITDFRLELGAGYETLWLLPIEPNSYLRLFHISYITIDDDPYVVRDPAPVDFGPFTWQGELAVLRDGGVLLRVDAVLTRDPPAYRIDATVRRPDGSERVFRLQHPRVEI